MLQMMGFSEPVPSPFSKTMVDSGHALQLPASQPHVVQSVFSHFWRHKSHWATPFSSWHTLTADTSVLSSFRRDAEPHASEWQQFARPGYAPHVSRSTT